MSSSSGSGRSDAMDAATPIAAQNTAPLVVAGVSHAFGGREVLRDVSLAIERGQRLTLLGLNGAGKTTLFSLITRLYDHRSGSIRVFGWEIKEKPSEALARIAAEVERVGLSDRLGDKVRQLSGGQRRRVEIARALLHRPQLLLLDEPTVGLDIASRQFLLDHVRDLCRDEGLAALWATHLIDEVDAAGQVVVLHRGRVLAHGAVADVIRETRASSMRGAFDTLTQERAA